MLHIRETPTIDSNDKQLKRHNTVLNLKLLLRYLIICTLEEHKRNNIKWVRIYSNNKRCINIQDRSHIYKFIHTSRKHTNIMYSHLTHIAIIKSQLCNIISQWLESCLSLSPLWIGLTTQLYMHAEPTQPLILHIKWVHSMRT